MILILQFKKEIFCAMAFLNWKTYLQELNERASLETKNFDSLMVGGTYQVKELFMKGTEKGEQVVAGVILKDAASTNMQYVYMPSTLVKNFTSEKVQQWNSRISKGSKAFFKYKGKSQINFGVGYKFDAEWVRSN